MLTAALAAGLVLGLAACGGDHKSAAEPATAPAPSVTPAGRSALAGPDAEGIVYDPVSRLVAVAVHGPDRLLLLDPTSLAVRRTVSLPGTVRHLQLGYGGGSVVVPVESARRVLQVALPSGAVRTSQRVGEQPHDAAELPDGDVVVGNEFGHSITELRDGRALRTNSDLTQPGGVIADGDTVGVVDVGAYTLSTYAAATLRRTGRVDAGKGPTHGVLVSGGRMLVLDTRGDAALAFTVRPLRQAARLALPGTPYGIAADSSTDLVWVTLTARNQVVGLDVSGTTPRVIARYPTVRQPNTVAVAPGSHTLWVTGTADGVVQRITR